MQHPEKTQPLGHSRGGGGGCGEDVCVCMCVEEEATPRGRGGFVAQIFHKSAKLFITEQREAVSFLV